MWFIFVVVDVVDVLPLGVILSLEYSACPALCVAMSTLSTAPACSTVMQEGIDSFSVADAEHELAAFEATNRRHIANVVFGGTEVMVELA
jgi:hypothetical protein